MDLPRALAIAPLALALHGFHSSVQPLSAPVRAELRNHGFWHKGCPVALSDLRVLAVTIHGWDGKRHTGRLVVNRTATAPLARVFRKLYGLNFPIHHMTIAGVYGPRSQQFADPSGSFECRDAVPSPCVGGNATGNWSMHAFGLAVDINPVENPYVGCGATRTKASRPFRDRTRHRKGMVTGLAVRAFASVGWGWGGSWTGNTKDYMHFSSTGH
jgi:hypothetical protein